MNAWMCERKDDIQFLLANVGRSEFDCQYCVSIQSSSCHDGDWNTSGDEAGSVVGAELETRKKARHKFHLHSCANGDWKLVPKQRNQHGPVNSSLSNNRLDSNARISTVSITPHSVRVVDNTLPRHNLLIQSDNSDTSRFWRLELYSLNPQL